MAGWWSFELHTFLPPPQAWHQPTGVAIYLPSSDSQLLGFCKGGSNKYLCQLPGSDSLIRRQQYHFSIFVSCTRPTELLIVNQLGHLTYKRRCRDAHIRKPASPPGLHLAFLSTWPACLYHQDHQREKGCQSSKAPCQLVSSQSQEPAICIRSFLC